MLARAGLPVVPPKTMTAAMYLAHMAVDKKVLDGQLRLVLLRDLGQALVTSEYPATTLESVLNADYAKITANI